MTEIQGNELPFGEKQMLRMKKYKEVLDALYKYFV